jgi:hypothetical protein
MDGGTAQVEIGEDWDVMLVGEVTAVYQATLSPEMMENLNGGKNHIHRR